MERIKTIARYADGRVVKGYTADFFPDAPRFHLAPPIPGASAPPVEVLLRDLKALFFVRDFAGNPRYQERKQLDPAVRHPGRGVEVVFEDGEVLVGYTMGYHPSRTGFFLFPVDPRSNNLRVFAVSAAVRRVLAATDRRELGPGPSSGGVLMVEPKLIRDVQAVVDVLRKTVSDWDTLVRAVEALTRDHGELRTRCDQLEREHEELRQTYERLRHEHDSIVRADAALRGDHEALRSEHETTLRLLRELRERHEAVLLERQAAADALEAILRRLKPASEDPAVVPGHPSRGIAGSS